MELVEGLAHVGDTPEGTPSHASVEAFVEALDGVADRHGVTVQAFDARYLVSARHLERAVELADRERARGEAIARDRGVEILLYAAGRRQISRALEMGVGEGETPVVALVSHPDADADTEAGAVEDVADLLEPASTLGEYDEPRIREFFGIGERELGATDATLADLVLERVALLVVER